MKLNWNNWQAAHWNDVKLPRVRSLLHAREREREVSIGSGAIPITSWLHHLGHLPHLGLLERIALPTHNMGHSTTICIHLRRSCWRARWSHSLLPLSLPPPPGLLRVLLTRAHLILQQPCKEPRAQRTDPTRRGKEERDQHCPLNKQEKCKVMGPRSGILSHQIILDSLCSLITSAETQTEPPIFMNTLLLFPLILPLHSIHCSLTEQCLCYQGIWCHQNCACWQANNCPGEALSPSMFSVLLKGTSCAVFPALV